MPGGTSVSPASTTRATHAPCAASAANGAAPGAMTLAGQPAATHGSSAPVSAAITAAWAICATVLPELMTAAGLSSVGHDAVARGRLLGRRLERRAHRLQALEQGTALRARARRQGDHGLAVGVAGQHMGLGEDLLPLALVRARRQTLPGRVAPRRDRLGVSGWDSRRAGRRPRGARKLARAGQLGDGATAQDEVHP